MGGGSFLCRERSNYTSDFIYRMSLHVFRGGGTPQLAAGKYVLLTYTISVMNLAEPW